jgi:hypothetical protein
MSQGWKQSVGCTPRLVLIIDAIEHRINTVVLGIVECATVFDVCVGHGQVSAAQQR